MEQSKKQLLKSTHLIIKPSDPQNLWDADWDIYMKSDEEKKLGTISFAGGKSLGVVPISIQLEERYRNQGYGTEAIKVMVDWAFLHKNVYEITALAEHENDKYIAALEKAGFVYREGDWNKESYSITKPRTTWLGLYLFIGLIAGFLIGILIGSAWLGMGIGMVFSFLIGTSMDKQANKEREKVTGKK